MIIEDNAPDDPDFINLDLLIFSDYIFCLRATKTLRESLQQEGVRQPPQGCIRLSEKVSRGSELFIRRKVDRRKVARGQFAHEDAKNGGESRGDGGRKERAQRAADRSQDPLSPAMSA